MIILPMTRIWWKIVFLLSLFNIVLFLFHFAVILMSSKNEQECAVKETKVHVKKDIDYYKVTNIYELSMKRYLLPRSVRHVMVSANGTETYYSNDNFTIIILTYGRTDVLLDLLQRYVKVVRAGKLPQLAKILVVWNNVNTSPPTERWNALGPYPVPVVFLRQTENKLTNRFLLFPEIDTEAIFTQDDDIYASPLDLKFALSIFKKFPEKLVGFYARMHALRKDGYYLYSSSPRHNVYSMILTGACFIHVDYLKLFQEQPESVRSKIDELMNGEDIAMNMMISNYTKDVAGYYVKPVYVGTIKSVLQGGETLHNTYDHIMKRSRCMNEMTKFYGMPLFATDVTLEQYLYTWKKTTNSSRNAKTKASQAVRKTKIISKRKKSS